MESTDREYFSQRAEVELKMAAAATVPDAAKAHYTLAGLYLNRVHSQPPEATVVDMQQYRAPSSAR